MDKTVDYQQALIDEIKELPQDTFPNLLQIIKLFKESVLTQRQQSTLELQKEFAEWEALSDEALTEFEKDL